MDWVSSRAVAPGGLLFYETFTTAQAARARPSNPAFLLEAGRAGASVRREDDPTGLRFRYPSYVQDIMGDIFSLGFGPFRWVCASGEPEDLAETDRIAQRIFEDVMKGELQRYCDPD